MSVRKLFNALTQQEEDATLVVDKNNEIVATFADGSFVKFPAGLDKKGFEELIKVHKTTNEGQEVVTEEQEAAEAAERAASEALIGETPGNTMPEGDKTDAPDSDTEEPA